MKQQELAMILDSFSREELPTLMNISGPDSLMYHVHYIERLVRSSEYYEIWRAYNKRYEDGNIDVIEQLDTSKHKKVKIELHHYPMTLFDICYQVGLKTIEDHTTTPYEVAKIVIQEHLLGHIGYVPLLITDHQKFHDGLIKIDIKEVKGNYKEFDNKYN